MRVSVLDSLILDSELLRILKESIIPVLNSFQLNRWTDEVQLLIKFLLWKYSVYDHGRSIGQNLLNLTYFSSSSRNKKTQLIWLFVLDSILPYIYSKIERFGSGLMSPSYWKWLDILHQSSQFLNLCIFLRNGSYPTLSHRITKLQMTLASQAQIPTSAYSSVQTRQLVWHYFADFLMIVLPIIKVHRLRNYLSRLTGGSGNDNKSPNSKMASTSVPDQHLNNIILKCCFCKEDATIPIVIPNTRCSFCYYCLKSNTSKDDDAPENNLETIKNLCSLHY